MEKTEQKSLINELAAKIQRAKKTKFGFLMESKRYFKINKSYVSDKELLQMQEFEGFVKKYPNLSNKDLVEIIKKKPILFKSLKKFVKRFPEFIDTLKTCGLEYTAAKYSKILETDELLKRG